MIVKREAPHLPRNRLRLTPDERRRQIVKGAVSYFAEFGFGGGTRELARRLGVTQPLIYRYFPSKEDLIRAVYEDVYLTQWDPEWEGMLTDSSQPLRERLIAFYERYTAIIFQSDWLRIYLFAGLRGLELNRWWVSFVEHHLLAKIAAALRTELGLPDLAAEPLSARELELYWLFHGGIFYYGLRRLVYAKEPNLPIDVFITGSIDAMLAGIPPLLRALLEPGQPDI